MGLFDYFKAKKEEKYPSYLVNGGYGTPKWTTQKDEQYLTEAYNKIVWVYACVSLISSNVSTVPWELWRIGKGANTKDKQIFEHPILNMLNKRINPHMTSKDFFDMWATYLATQGKFYATLNNAVLPTELYPLYPHKIKPIPHRTNFVDGFEYQISNQQTIYRSKDVLWSKFNDPLDFYEGLSPIRAMARTIDTENEAVDWNKSQLQNQAVPPGAIRVQNPSPEMQNKLRTEWKKRYAGAKNARVPLVLNAEKADYIQFGLSAIDMDFLNQRTLSRVEICAGFKVPSQVAGDPEGQTYANYQEAVKSLWNQCLIPDYLDRMKDCLNLYIVSKYGDNLEIRYNLDHVGALQENRSELIKDATISYEKQLLTKNEARDLMGYDEVEGGEEYYQPPKKEEPKKDEEEQDNNSKEEEKKELKSINLDSEDKKKEFWMKNEKEREKYDNAIDKQLQKAFDVERSRVVKAIEKVDKYSQVDKVAKKVIRGSNDKLKILQAGYGLIINDFGKKTFKDIAKLKADKFDVTTEAIREYIATQTAKQVVQIDETTVEQIRQRVLLGESQGLGAKQIAKLIDDLYLEQIIPNRSTVIARTEVVSASNYGSLSGAEQATEEFGVNVKKYWIRTFDNRVRDTHKQAGTTPAISLSDTFVVGTSEMMYPGDFNGDVHEVVNCRCTLGYERG